MSAHDNGGPAFPRDDCNNGYEGMSLRDWFAATVPLDVANVPEELMVKLAGEVPEGDTIERLAWFLRVTAAIRYMQADAMLAERAKAEGQS